MITPIQDKTVDIIRADINSISNISERLVRISRLRDVLILLGKEAEAAKPIDFPLWAGTTMRGSFISHIWIRADVATEAHQLASNCTHNKKPSGMEDCGNAANPSVPYVVYNVFSSGHDLWNQLRNLLGEPGQIISGMGKLERERVSHIIENAKAG